MKTILGILASATFVAGLATIAIAEGDNSDKRTDPGLMQHALASGSQELMTNTMNPFDKVGADHNRLLGELVKITGTNPQETWEQRWHAAVEMEGPGARKLNPSDFQHFDEAAVVSEARRLDPEHATIIGRYYQNLEIALQEDRTYAQAMSAIASSETRLIKDQNMNPVSKGALEVAYATARYSAYYWSGQQGGGTSNPSIKINWKAVGKVVLKDALGAAGGFLGGGGPPGAVIGGALASIPDLMVNPRCLPPKIMVGSDCVEDHSGGKLKSGAQMKGEQKAQDMQGTPDKTKSLKWCPPPKIIVGKDCVEDHSGGKLKSEDPIKGEQKTQDAPEKSSEPSPH